MELFGLAIVVVIIIMATIFVLIFSFNKAPSEGRKEFIESRQSSAFINTMLKVNVDEPDCTGILMSDLIRLCVQSPPANCGNTDSCDVAEDVIREILGKTLEVWNKDNYYFTISRSSDTDSPIRYFGTICQGDKSSEEYHIPGTTPAIAKLDICR
ncbi:hypothetical protein HYT54_02610 [Candidatus Woesearchaeota archaeon]|nr:hypothetical protein [Candidatus Woesearchaeota archaeon]